MTIARITPTISWPHDGKVIWQMVPVCQKNSVREIMNYSPHFKELREIPRAFRDSATLCELA
jgi:hypothetical protein